MKLDVLKQFSSLRNKLESERRAIQNRLAAIYAALNGKMGAVPVTPTAKGPSALRLERRGRKPGKKPFRPDRKPRKKSVFSLKEAVRKVTAQRPLTKREIVAAVQKIGYKFAAKRPTRSLENFLYNKKNKFKNQSGKWSAW
jgi:hypothetical protein